MAEADGAAERRRPRWWVVALGFLVLTFGTVQMLWTAWSLRTAEECPTVVDESYGRGLDLECAPRGGMSRDVAVLMVTALGLMSGGIIVGAVLRLARGARYPGAGEPQDADDPADEPDDLHARGVLTDEESQAASAPVSHDRRT